MRPLYDKPTISSENISGLSIRLASPETIRKWSSGAVTKPDTINYRTQKPEKGGLFCQRIFGPVKDYECACKLHTTKAHEGTVCEHCGVLVAPASVRRERMGHIELGVTVANPWFARGNSSFLSKLLGIKQKDIDAVLAYIKYLVIDPGKNTDLVLYQVLTEKEFNEYEEKYEDDFTAKKGAEAFKDILTAMNLDDLVKSLVEEFKTATSKQKKQRAFVRLGIAKMFRDSGNRPEWMLLDVIPVLPPDLRPMAQMDGGNFAISDINELYKRVITRNNRLLDMIERGAPTVILDNERRMLQQAVDCLFDNSKVPAMQQAIGANKRHLKSLSEALGGKTGRFRQNLLGKRVDYSGRSVICVEPKLKIWQCGLPKPLALELFKPFVVKRLCDTRNINVKAATKMVERMDECVWDALENVIDGHPVFLNRAPTLHRLGIQAFQPILVEGHAIKLNPLVCTAFNADFDGDQMAVHLPLSAEAQAEARFLMLASNNLLKPSDGKPVAVPSQDMVLGAYYLTMDKGAQKGDGSVFRDKAEAEMAYQVGSITLHSHIKVRRTGYCNNEPVSKLIECTLGKLIFNEIIPQDLGYVDRNDPEHCLDLEINTLVKKKELGAIAARCIEVHNMTVSSEVLDNMKALGYKYATLAGFTVSVFDATIPEEKAEIIANAEAKSAKLNEHYMRGRVSKEGKSEMFIKIWNDATDEVTEKLENSFDAVNNPIHIMADSGARGSIAQIRQLAGMRGLIANTSGATIEMPIKSNYREGLSGLEYFISARGARKGLADTALRTADSGYMTRRLVDVAHSAVIRAKDCGTTEGIIVRDIYDRKDCIESMEERLVGRYLVEDFDTEGVKVSKDTLITKSIAKQIAGTGVQEVKVRSSLTCRCTNGICAKCYGVNLATNKQVQIGDAVGIISAQSIGEPGTQLTMRTFHTGGVASGDGDITQGLPRVEEVFENRQPKRCAILSEIDGVVSFDDSKRQTHIVVTNDKEQRSYPLHYSLKKAVRVGDTVKAGDFLTDGVIKPSDLLAIKGEPAAQDYIIAEIQKVYRVQGVDINDKHIEVILKYLMRKVKITDPGDTNLVMNMEYDKVKVKKLNDKFKAMGKKPAEYEVVLEGLTKAGVHCDSFLSAASFQETTRVLSEAAIKGKRDKLDGLKENVIIGKLIPAGTGLVDYESINVVERKSKENE